MVMVKHYIGFDGEGTLESETVHDGYSRHEHENRESRESVLDFHCHDDDDEDDDDDDTYYYYCEFCCCDY